MKKIFLKTPEGTKVQRHTVNWQRDEVELTDIRFTVGQGKFRRLVGLARYGKIIWTAPGFSA